MLMIIIGVIIIGSLFIVFENFRNKRQGNNFQPTVGYEYDAPRVIELPENIEREKKRRHIR